MHPFTDLAALDAHQLAFPFEDLSEARKVAGARRLGGCPYLTPLKPAVILFNLHVVRRSRFAKQKGYIGIEPMRVF